MELASSIGAIGLCFHQTTAHIGRNERIHRLLRRVQNLAQLFLGYPFWLISNFFKHPHAKVGFTVAFSQVIIDFVKPSEKRRKEIHHAFFAFVFSVHSVPFVRCRTILEEQYS